MKVKEGKEKAYESWRNQTRGLYGRGCFIFAEKWAALMEKEIESSTDCPLNVICCNAARLSQEADDEGITGFMLGSSANILIECWLYGEYLGKRYDQK